MAKTDEERRRVMEFVLRKMGERGMDALALTKAAGLDPQTVRTFLRGETWPQTKKRTALEAALSLPAGSFDLIAAGLGAETVDEDADEVEAAIRRSTLTRANQHTLIGTYYGMLEQQAERGVG